MSGDAEGQEPEGCQYLAQILVVFVLWLLCPEPQAGPTCPDLG